MRFIDRPVRSIVRAIADASSRWSDADFPARVRVLDAICRRTGYSLPVVEYALDRLFSPITRNAIEAVIGGELGSLDVLDGFTKRANGDRVRALPLGRICVLSSRTTIGVALVPAIFAVCAKCPVLVKDRGDRLAAAFFATLAEELGESQAAAAEVWDGVAASPPLDAFAGIVAFGSDATLRTIAATLPPTTRFIGYGSKATFGYVAREALAGEAGAGALAHAAARDLLLYDTQGCLSLHGLFVERGGSVTPDRFAALLARAVERTAIEFPIGTQDVQTPLDIAAVRDLAAFRAAAGQGGVYSDALGTYCITVDPPAAQAPAFLPRTLGVRGVDSPADAAAYVAQHRLPIEALAVAGMRPDIADMAAGMRVARIARFGELQSPPLESFHGGRPRIGEFVTWIADET